MLSRNIVKITGSPKILYHIHKKTLANRQCGLLSCLFSNTHISRCKTNSTLPNGIDRIWNDRIRHGSTGFSRTKGAQSQNQNITKPKLKSSKETASPQKTTLVNEEDVAEKYFAGLSSDIHTKKRVYKNDVLRVLLKVKDANFSTKKQGLLLLQCCTEILPDETPNSRMELAQKVWDTIKHHSKLDVDYYNELLRVYIANKKEVVPSQFIDKMAPIEPNATTFELLLKMLAEVGNLNQATEVISNMKVKNHPASENVFNALIVCQGKSGNVNNIQEILTMMNSLKIERTAETYTALARAFAFNKMVDKMFESMSQAQSSGIQLEERHVMEVVKTLPECGMVSAAQKVLSYLPKDTLYSPSISPYMQVVATELVFRNEPLLALEIYKCLPTPSFGPKDDQGLHGRGLVRDCVKASMPSGVIALITQDLMASGRNPIAIQNAAEAALQLGKSPLALDLFTRMKQLGMPIRCHYFWPILLQNMRGFGEKGIMHVLKTMVTMEVTPDYDTMIDYVLPYVSFTSPQNLMKKFLEAELSANMVLTPMMEILINSGQVRSASELCELFYAKIEAEKLIKPLVKGYLLSMDLKNVTHILEDISKRASDQNKDWIGRFLCQFLKQKRMKEDFKDFLDIVKELQRRELYISTTAADFCLSRLPDSYDQKKREEIKDLLIKVTDENMVDEGELFDHSIPHPKQMNEEGLRAHLAELEAKGMNTRRVLRKLLQEYCRKGNLTEAREIVDKCRRSGVFLSAGMKASIFDLHVKLGELDEAELALADLNKMAPYFLLDEYKVIDFATLMVYRKRIDKAFDMINEQTKKRKVIGGRNISMNCWRLLDAVAAHNSLVETKNMFDLLTSLGYCKPSNAICGPLIRAHLKTGNIEEAVEEFVQIADRYSQTPLKHELLCRILQEMSVGASEEVFLTAEKNNGKYNKLVQKILSVDKKIHGASDVQLTLIAALADVGYKKTLRKMFLDPTVKFHPDALMRRCERFADEKKIHALENIAECGFDARQIDVSEIYDMILDVLQRDDEVDAALEVWTKMQENNVVPSQKFVKTLCAMAKSNNKPIPPEISVLLDKKHIAKKT